LKEMYIIILTIAIIITIKLSCFAKEEHPL